LVNSSTLEGAALAVTPIASIERAFPVGEGVLAIVGQAIVIVTRKTLCARCMVRKRDEPLFARSKECLSRAREIAVAIVAAKALGCVPLVVEDDLTVSAAAITQGGQRPTRFDRSRPQAEQRPSQRQPYTDSESHGPP